MGLEALHPYIFGMQCHSPDAGDLSRRQRPADRILQQRGAKTSAPVLHRHSETATNLELPYVKGQCIKTEDGARP